MIVATPTDRRWSKRMDVLWNARIRSDRQSTREAQACNIGLEGLFLAVAELPAAKGEVLELELEIPTGDMSINGDKKIFRMPVCVIHRWPNGFGITFLLFNSALFQELDRFFHTLPGLEHRTAHGHS